MEDISKVVSNDNEELEGLESLEFMARLLATNILLCKKLNFPEGFSVKISK